MRRACRSFDRRLWGSRSSHHDLLRRKRRTQGNFEAFEIRPSLRSRPARLMRASHDCFHLANFEPLRSYAVNRKAQALSVPPAVAGGSVSKVKSKKEKVKSEKKPIFLFSFCLFTFDFFTRPLPQAVLTCSLNCVTPTTI